VEAAHEKGLVHRDVKPGNIMQTVDGRVVVTDFGLVRGVGERGMTMTGVMMGTPGYMAPEQVRGEPEEIDERTDVYGMGATLYQMAGWFRGGGRRFNIF
jgi:serine/threonine-protein kinase